MTLQKLELARLLEDISSKLVKISREIFEVSGISYTDDRREKEHESYLLTLRNEKSRLEKLQTEYLKEINSNLDVLNRLVELGVIYPQETCLVEEVNGEMKEVKKTFLAVKTKKQIK
jgi:hypothetical protein